VAEKKAQGAEKRVQKEKEREEKALQRATRKQEALVAREERTEIRARKEAKKAVKEARKAAKSERIITKMPNEASIAQNSQESGSSRPTTSENSKVVEKATRSGRVVKYHIGYEITIYFNCNRKSLISSILIYTFYTI
jgi:membrane protein involved in colicin uptake